MTVFNFNDAERELLIAVMLEHVISLATDYAALASGHGERLYKRARLLQACRITGELHDPSATLGDALESPRFTISDMEEAPRDARSDPFMRAAAENEGIDLDKELGPFDRRAAAPRCTHGKLFTDECAACNDRCPHGLEMTSPCAGCGRGVVAHADTCPVSRPDFVPLEGERQCNCDFGPRLAAELGMPFLVADPKA